MSKKLSTIEAKKSLGQHFLNNARIPELMAEAAQVTKGDTILEIGPGTGALTRTLLEKEAKVIAIEADTRAIEALKLTYAEEVTEGRLTIFHEDVRVIHLKKLGFKPYSFKIVANIPYYLSGMLFRTFLESDIQPSHLVFLVQKEVAERIARDKKESLLSLSIKVFGDPVYVKTVGKGNFTPAPKIDSAIIAVHNISHTHLTEAGITKEFFFTVLHEGFKSKRKQLLGNLSGIFPREVLVRIFSNLQLPLTVRGEDLPLKTWLTLCTEIQQSMEQK